MSPNDSPNSRLREAFGQLLRRWTTDWDPLPPLEQYLAVLQHIQPEPPDTAAWKWAKGLLEQSARGLAAPFGAKSETASLNNDAVKNWLGLTWSAIELGTLDPGSSLTGEAEAALARCAESWSESNWPWHQALRLLIERYWAKKSQKPEVKLCWLEGDTCSENTCHATIKFQDAEPRVAPEDLKIRHLKFEVELVDCPEATEMDGSLLYRTIHVKYSPVYVSLISDESTSPTFCAPPEVSPGLTQSFAFSVVLKSTAPPSDSKCPGKTVTLDRMHTCIAIKLRYLERAGPAEAESIYLVLVKLTVT